MASSLNDGATANAASASICIPCSELNESALLSLDQVKTELTTMPLWSLAAIVPSRDHAQGGIVAATATTASLPPPTTSTSTMTSTSSSQGWCLRRYFVAKNFQAALTAINAIGTIAERENHHPDSHLIQYRSVEIILWTHKLSGITRNDIQLAKSLILK
jgi:pterin-4a-carbinolamine dehydratase